MVIPASNALVPHVIVLDLAAILPVLLVERRRIGSHLKRYALSPNISINIVGVGIPMSNRSHPGLGCNALTNAVCFFGSPRFLIKTYTLIMSVYVKVVAAPAAQVLAIIILIKVDKSKQ